MSMFHFPNFCFYSSIFTLWIHRLPFGFCWFCFLQSKVGLVSGSNSVSQTRASGSCNSFKLHRVQLPSNLSASSSFLSGSLRFPSLRTSSNPLSSRSAARGSIRASAEVRIYALSLHFLNEIGEGEENCIWDLLDFLQNRLLCVWDECKPSLRRLKMASSVTLVNEALVLFSLILGSTSSSESNEQGIFWCEHWKSSREACWEDCDWIIWGWCAPNGRELPCSLHRYDIMRLLVVYLFTLNIQVSFWM